MLYVINILYYLIADLDLLLVISCYSKLCYGVKIVLSQDEYLLPTTSKPLIYLCFLRSYNYTRTKNRQVSSETCRFLFLLGCFLAQQILEQDAHVIAAAIQNSVNIDIVALHTVKHHIITADKKTIVRSYICNGG